MAVPLALLISLLAQNPAPAGAGVAPEPAAGEPAGDAVVAPVTSAPRVLPLLLVLDVGGDHVPAAEREALTEAFTLALARRLDLEVQSPRSLMDRINFAEQQQQAGCDSSVCMAEIANAMGARFVVFSRVVQLGDEQILRADVYDNGVGRSLALAAVQAGSVRDLTRRLPNLVDDLVSESHGELPLRAVERPVEVPVDTPMSSTTKSGLVVAGVGAGAALVGGGLAVVGFSQVRALTNARDAYLNEPTIDNARDLVRSRAPVPDDTVTLSTLGGACVGGVGLIAVVIGAVVAWSGLPPAAEAEAQ